METYDLHGFSHYFSLCDDFSSVIGLAAKITGPFSLLEKHAEKAALACYKKHPFLGSTILKSVDKNGPNKAVLNRNNPSCKLVEILPASAASWKDVLFKEIHKRVDREKGPLCWWKLIPPVRSPKGDQSSEESYVLIISDHIVTDGISLTRVMNDFLAYIVNRKEYEPLNPVDIMEPIQKQMFSKSCSLWRKVKDWWDLKQYIRWLGKYRPLLPAESSNTAHAFYSTGENFRYLHAVCKSKGVTIQATLQACLLAAIYPHLSLSSKNFENCWVSKGKNKANLSFSVYMNLRNRLPVPIDNNNVGAYMNEAHIGWSQRTKEGFWNFVLNGKNEMDIKLKKEVIYDDYLFFDKLVKKYTPTELSKILKRGFFNDATISNLGNYPFDLQHKSADSDEVLKIETLHLICSDLGPCAQLSFYVVGANERLNYSLYSRVEQSIGKSIFDNWVWLCENCYAFNDKITLEDVIKVISPIKSG